MRDVLSASLAETSLLALSSSLVLAQTTTPVMAPSDAVAAPTRGIAEWWWVLLLAIVIAAAVWYFTRKCTTL
jgi:type II secretory pathway component PulF